MDWQCSSLSNAWVVRVESLGLHIGHRRVHLRCTGIDWDGFTPFGKHDLVEIHVVEKRGEVERP